MPPLLQTNRKDDSFFSLPVNEEMSSLAYSLMDGFYTHLTHSSTVNSEDLFQPQNAKLAREAPGVEQPTVGLFQPQLGQN